MKKSLFNFHAIGFKLGLYVLLATLLVISSMGYFFYHLLTEKTEIEISNKLHEKVQTIDQYLQQAELSLKLLGVGIKTLYQGNNTVEQDYKQLTLESFQQRTPLVMALGFGQTPYSIFKDKQWFWPYFYVDQHKFEAIGAPLPAPNQNIRYADLAPEDEYYEQDYYTGPMEKKINYWSETYDWYGIVMTSYLLPIRDKNKHIIAIGATDVNVTALAQLLDEPVINKAGEFMLLSEKGKLLVYPDDSVQHYQDAPDLNYLWQHIDRQDNGLLQYKGAFWAYEYIPSNQWLMLAKVPKSVVLNPIMTLVISNSVGAVVILLLLVFMFIYRLNKRLQTLVQQCNRMTQNEQKRYNKWSKLIGNLPLNDLPLSVINTRHQDELEVLSTAFSIMEDQLSISLKVLENHAHTLKTHVAQRTESLNLANKALEKKTASLREARDLAMQANIEKSNFIANMSHELRTPLNAIIGYCELLIEEQELDEQMDVADLYRVHSAAMHLLGLVNDVLNISKIESGKMEIVLHQVNIQQLLTDIETHIMPLAVAQKNKFTLHNNSQYSNLLLDEMKCRQILLNLLSNAVKFTEKGAVTLTVIDSLRDNTAYICFQIQDTGIGISPEQQKKLFKPFVQADSSTVRKYGGTGLGLAISKHFTEMMAGFIELDSQLHQGACFSVYFPVKTVDADFK